MTDEQSNTIAQLEALSDADMATWLLRVSQWDFRALVTLQQAIDMHLAATGEVKTFRLVKP